MSEAHNPDITLEKFTAAMRHMFSIRFKPKTVLPPDMAMMFPAWANHGGCAPCRDYMGVSWQPRTDVPDEPSFISYMAHNKGVDPVKWFLKAVWQFGGADWLTLVGDYPQSYSLYGMTKKRLQGIKFAAEMELFQRHGGPRPKHIPE